jgi:GTPase SAR1 family protein
MLRDKILNILKKKKAPERLPTSPEKMDIIKNILEENMRKQKYEQWESNQKQWDNLEKLNKEVKEKTGREGIWLRRENIAKSKKNNIV